MKIFVPLTFIIIPLLYAKNYSFTYFSGIFLVDNAATECFYQPIEDKKYKYLEVTYYSYDGDDTTIAYNVYFNESRKIDSMNYVSNYNGKYDLEGDGVGIGVYKICFEVVHTTYQQEPVYLKLELSNDESVNANGIETSNSVGNEKEKSGIDVQLDKISSYFNNIRTAQAKYRQFEHISREEAEETHSFTNYCNLIILIVSLLTYIIHIYVITDSTTWRSRLPKII